MEQNVLETMERLTNEKIKKKIFPTHITWVDLRKELGSQITEAILKLIEDGKIKTGHTLNDRYLKLITVNNSTNEKAN
ncbi:hypothetical protein L3049_14155 [Labilibaculum sp. DW002]|uniref:Uncharacterized protein n=1 Tax=Paralabilibaculum antarcticum TaxID=2912572 RepID=A0ABT5VUP2_9BACT|nr:hypothetical protein [Labilibaculum sp. DW002]MDE5419139.1 hypothetical protein [Labilibaculum sp. DW002]